MKIRLILTALSLLVFAAFSSACDCDGEEVSLKESFAKSATVFLGTVVSIEGYESTIKATHGLNWAYIIEFKPKELFKGENSETIKLIVEASDCGGGFMKGNSYLVFAFMNEQENKLGYHQCFKMALEERYASEEIIKLKEMN
ncbi:hypothetical protein WJR50_05135 [Catalinimonas sp. 4WD22]|uniref:hypothetical protein n=1 Tax=Catalinimonas locisalis TaxID=3133978 RepID=UPI003100B7C4